MIDVSEPDFYPDREPGYSNFRISIKNYENATRTYVILVQLQDSQAYTTQIVETDVLSLDPNADALMIIDYEEEEYGKRLMDVFVWTGLDNPEPIASFSYINDGYGGQFAKIPMSSERTVELSHLLSACAYGYTDPECNYVAREKLYVANQECISYREFRIALENSICTDERLSEYT